MNSIDVSFSKENEITKNDVVKLMIEVKLSSEAKSKLKSIIGGNDIGFHRWHQIYDVIRFYKEFRFPNKYWNIVLIRGQEDKQFQMIFKNLFGSWLDILLQINLNRFSITWEQEIEKRKKISDENSQRFDPNF